MMVVFSNRRIENQLNINLSKTGQTVMNDATNYSRCIYRDIHGGPKNLHISICSICINLSFSSSPVLSWPVGLRLRLGALGCRPSHTASVVSDIMSPHYLPPLCRTIYIS